MKMEFYFGYSRVILWPSITKIEGKTDFQVDHSLILEISGWGALILSMPLPIHVCARFSYSQFSGMDKQGGNYNWLVLLLQGKRKS